MPSRAAHSKSRDGCSRCKQRKVRCDKQVPKCANCTRRDECCEYQTWKLVVVMPASAEAGVVEDAGQRMDISAAANTGILNELETIPAIKPEPSEKFLNGLFASWAPFNDSPGVVLPPDPAFPEEVQIWREAVNLNAPFHPYLRLCFNSIYQLFVKRAEPDVTREEKSRAYQDQIAASNLFRGSQVTINESNWIAVLIFSVSLIIFQFASQQATVGDTDGDIDYIETMHVLKTSAGVASAVAPFLWRSPVWKYIRMRSEMAWQPMDPELSAALYDLKSTVNLVAADDPSRREVMSVAVQALIDWSSLCNGRPRTYKDYVIFPGMVSSEYLQLLAGGDDLALLVLIYWCAIMRAGAGRWFLIRWLPQTASLARGRLKADWSHVLGWPNAVMDGRQV